MKQYKVLKREGKGSLNESWKFLQFKNKTYKNVSKQTQEPPMESKNDLTLLLKFKTT